MAKYWAFVTVIGLCGCGIYKDAARASKKRVRMRSVLIRFDNEWIGVGNSTLVIALGKAFAEFL